ncbi:Uncharacterised protein [BD1-7 clade bacterium]|uniref:Uncharacterized protein n=1 Tax=BD1-7 clade bacterium TaxID=2029982 RepID=A0A5S9Q5R7_9GAMM|nr:Uncharacterised protein [BD1-7 clade bacterium]
MTASLMVVIVLSIAVLAWTDTQQLRANRQRPGKADQWIQSLKPAWWGSIALVFIADVLMNNYTGLVLHLAGLSIAGFGTVLIRRSLRQ